MFSRFAPTRSTESIAKLSIGSCGEPLGAQAGLAREGRLAVVSKKDYLKRIVAAPLETTVQHRLYPEF